MSQRLSRISLALVFLLTGEVWALGLGDIRLESALNEPLRAEIELLSATPEELANLQVALASAATFERYGIDRPYYLQGIQFNVVRTGRADGNIIQVRSGAPMTEPFLTFLVEASWSRGRLLREYTVLLDPPTFAPPRSAESTPAVIAPRESAPADSGRIERPAQPPEPRQPTPPAAEARPRPQPTPSDAPYASGEGGEYVVQRGDTLWGIAQRERPDSRLTMNQTMIAIYEANPGAFGGNINLLRAGARLRVPSAGDIYRISRGDANGEVARQNEAWGSGAVAPPPVDTATRPSLTLVPPDEDLGDGDAGVDGQPEAGLPTREDEIVERIDELEADVPDQPALIEIRDNELAALRQELANIRGEVYEPPVADTVEDIDESAPDDVAGDEPLPDYDEVMVDDAEPVDVEDVAADDDVEAADTPPPADIIRAPTRSEPSLIDRALGALTSIWAIVVGALLVAGAVLVWFVRRGRGAEEDVGPWRPLDAEDAEPLTATESMAAPSREDAFVVVEQESRTRTDAAAGDTIETPPPEFLTEVDEDTGTFGSLEDTFSSDTAINLDQSDPIAEADFHMAYGLYDQAADLVNGALGVEPNRQDLLTKLCEIYFVWGNRDAFVDAASRLKNAVGGAESADWDKTVIMGQQIAGDHDLFAGASAAAATRAVDLAFDAGMDQTGALDMEFVADSEAASDFIDLGGAGDEADASGLDFDMGSGSRAVEMPETEPTVEMPEPEQEVESEATLESTAEFPMMEPTIEMPEGAEPTVETPTIEQQFDSLGGTAELPTIPDTIEDEMLGGGQSAEHTAEINLDDLGLDLEGLDETEIASFDDLDGTAESETLSATGLNEALGEDGDITGKNPKVDPNATGVQRAISSDDTAEMFVAEFDDTGISTDVDIDSSLLDATGMTQVLSDDLAVETASDVDKLISDDDATLLAGLDDDGDFDFAKTEALPKEAFEGDPSLDDTGEAPAVASTDVDLDLDDLTAALKVSAMGGDTIEQLREDKTIEQPRLGAADRDDAATMELGPDEFSDDLQDARTMTEVGTKLDLARAYVDMGDPSGARSILEEVLDEGDEGQRQQAQQLLDSLQS